MDGHELNLWAIEVSPSDATFLESKGAQHLLMQQEENDFKFGRIDLISRPFPS